MTQFVLRAVISDLYSLTSNHSDRSGSPSMNFFISSQTIFAWRFLVAAVNSLP